MPGQCSRWLALAAADGRAGHAGRRRSPRAKARDPQTVPRYSTLIVSTIASTIGPAQMARSRRRTKPPSFARPKPACSQHRQHMSASVPVRARPIEQRLRPLCVHRVRNACARAVTIVHSPLPMLAGHSCPGVALRGRSLRVEISLVMKGSGVRVPASACGDCRAFAGATVRSDREVGPVCVHSASNAASRAATSVHERRRRGAVANGRSHVAPAGYEREAGGPSAVMPWARAAWFWPGRSGGASLICVSVAIQRRGSSARGVGVSRHALKLGWRRGTP